jgi:hypothetical protein
MSTSVIERADAVAVKATYADTNRAAVVRRTVRVGRKSTTARAIIVRTHGRASNAQAANVVGNSIYRNPYQTKGAAAKLGRRYQKVAQRTNTKMPKITVSSVKVKVNRQTGAVSVKNRTLGSTYLTSRKAVRNYNRKYSGKGSVATGRKSTYIARDSKGRFK